VSLFRTGDRRNIEVLFEIENGAKSVISQARETKEKITQTTAFVKPNGVFYSEHSSRNEIIDQRVLGGWLI
jgi:hypothetical protein